MQLKRLQKRLDDLHKIHGHKSLVSVYGAGCIKNPKVMFIFMNPTGKNISSQLKWKGLRAPWLGTKNVWRIFYELKILTKEYFEKTQKLKPEEWTRKFCKEIYGQIAKNKIYITNLAKCTQPDARPLKNSVFRDYLEIMKEEILAIKPEKIITFGNQVSSILLGKAVKVSNYKDLQKELIKINGETFDVFPNYYPLGQGQRNMPLAIKIISKILNQRTG